jgi:hypothetical protein
VREIAQNVAQPIVCQNQYISQQFWATFVILINLPKVNDRPLGDNSPNLATLIQFNGTPFSSSFESVRM